MVGVAGALQMKNMSSAFMKEDRQSYWNRRPANADQVMERLKAKRRKLFQKGPEDPNGSEEQNDDADMEGTKLEDATDMLADAAAKEEADEQEDGSDSDASDAEERKTSAKGKGRDTVSFLPPKRRNEPD